MHESIACHASHRCPVIEIINYVFDGASLNVFNLKVMS